MIFPTATIANTTDSRSPLWFLEWILYFTLLILAVRKSDGVRMKSVTAIVAYGGLSLLFSAVYELTLTVDGTGLGGFHESTASSFLLASGFYVPATLAATWTARRWSMDFRSMFFFAFGVSLNEALIFRPMLLETLLSSQAFLTPVITAFYATVYALFYAMPLLIIAPTALRRADASPQPMLIWIILWGVLAGFACNLFMGLVHAPLMMAIFGIAPTQGG